MAELKYLVDINLLQNQLIFPKIHTLGTAPTSPSPTEGQLYFDSSTGDKALHVYNGSAWVRLAGQTSAQTVDTIASGDFIAFSDENEAFDINNKLTIDNLFKTAPNLVDAGAIADGDSLLFIDADDSNLTKKEAVADIATLFAGAGMTAGSSVINVIGGDGITANADNVAITAAQTTVTTVTNAALKLARDTHNFIDFGTDNQIKFTVSTNQAITFKASGEIEATKFDGDLEGNADSATLADEATILADSRNIAATGDIAWNVDFNGSADVTAAATIQATSVEGSMLNNNIVSGLTDIGAAIVKTDELIISDAGAIKRTDVSRLGTFFGGDGLAVSNGVLAVGVDDSSIEINSDAIRVKAGGIVTAMLANDAVNADKLASNSVVNASVTANAAIVQTKINTNVDLGGDIVFGNQTNDTVKFTGHVSSSFTSTGSFGIVETPYGVNFTGDNHSDQGAKIFYTNASSEDKIVIQAGTRNMLEIHNPYTGTTGEVVVNEDSLIVDFRVESNGNDHMIYSDGNNNRVGIGKNNPAAVLDVNGAIALSGTITGATTIDASTDFTVGNLVITDNTLTGTALNLAGGSGEIDLTTTGALDLNSGAYTLNSAANTTTATGALAIVTTGGSSDISIVSSHTSGVAFHLDANAHAGSEVQIDAGVLDIDVTAGITIDGTTLSIDSTDTTNITTTGSGKSMTINATGGGTQVLTLASAGTGQNAIDINATAGGLDVDVVRDIALTTTGDAGEIQLISAHGEGRAVFIDANVHAGSIVDIDAGVLDIDVTRATTIDTTSLTVTSPSVTFTSGDSTDPIVSIINTNDDPHGASLKLIKNTSNSAATNDAAGTISFLADDAGNNETEYGRIKTIAAAVTAGSESGKMLFGVATTATGAYADILTITGGANAAGSTVAIAGNLTVAGTTTTQNTVLVENTVSVLVFEGANDDAHATTLKVVEPTATLSYALPNLSAGDYFLPAIVDAASDASAAVTAAEFALLDGGSTIGTTATLNGDGFFHNDAGTMKHTNVHSLATLFAGSGLTATNSVIAVDTLNQDTTGTASKVTVTNNASGTAFPIVFHDESDGLLDDTGTFEYTPESGVFDVPIVRAHTSLVPNADDGATIGSANLNFSDLFLADEAVLNFGDDQDVKLTHVPDAGILLNDAMKIQFDDASQFIHANSNAELTIAATDAINLTSTDVVISGTATTTGVHTFTEIPLFPNDTIETADIQGEAVTLAKMADLARGKIIIGNSSSKPTALAAGTNGQVLTSDGTDIAFADAVGASHKSTIGNGSLTTMEVTHSLNTKDVMVQLYDMSSLDTVYAQVIRTTVNTIDITFNTAPANNDIRVLITKL